MPPRRRVTVVTAGHLSTCPRMLKSADALAGAGYDVHVVATAHEPWATVTDLDVRLRRGWPMSVVNYRKGQSGLTYWWTGIEHRAARAAVSAVGLDRTTMPVVARAFARVHAALVRAVCAQPADLIYGGTTGALAAIAEAARRTRTPFAVDFEDLHSGETSGPDAPAIDALATRIERDVIADAAFVTTSSEAIAAEYQRRYGVDAAVVHNTFPLPVRPPDFRRRDPDTFRAYWFSQTIAPGRGLEEAVTALGRIGVATELTVLGRAEEGYLETVRRLGRAGVKPVTVRHQPPVAPDEMIDRARGYDVGLALDCGTPLNRELCMTNKAFTYILAGIPVVIADTPGQHALGVDLGAGAALVRGHDVDALAAAFSWWANNPAALDAAKRAAWQRAADRWHWEHQAERGTLLRRVEHALS
jgi:glycosyltransferase involved in cell wall biosynthesis